MSVQHHHLREMARQSQSSVGMAPKFIWQKTSRCIKYAKACLPTCSRKTDMTTLLTVPVRRKRDLLRVRESARRIASLLRFDPQDQACIAAGAFAVAAQASERMADCEICIQVDEATLHIFFQTSPSSSGLDQQTTCLPQP